MTSDDVLSRIASLTARAPLTASVASEALGVTLERTSDGEFFAVYEAKGDDTFSHVWLQGPKKGATHQGRVSVTLAAGACVKVDQAREQFGFAHKRPVHPGKAAPELDFWLHNGDWGQLRLGYDRKSGCLVEATLEAKQAR